jgi:TfoX/Sxy family transcriptional regulator of competence genes
MAWRKSPPTLVSLFDSVIPDDRRISRRKMFGYPAAFVNGNLFAGLHQESFILRLSAADREIMKDRLGATTFEPIKGRQMREYVVLPEDLLTDGAQLARWLEQSLAYAHTLVPKSKKRPGRAPGTKRKQSPK